MAKRRNQRWAREAAMQALVRFGPEASGLRALERQAKSTYQMTTKTAAGAAQTIVGEVDRARPAVKRNYDQAGLDAARAAHKVINPVMNSLGPAAGTLAAATKLSQGTGARRLAEERAASLTDLSQRRVQAVQGAQFAQANARDTLVGELAKIFERQQDLRRERGAFTAATAGQLREAARDRAQQMDIAELSAETQRQNSRRTQRQSERNSLRSAGINPETGKPIPGGRLDPKEKDGKGREWASSAQQQAARRDFQQALDYAKDFSRERAPRHEAANVLKRGLPASEDEVIYDPQTGKPKVGKDGKRLKAPGTPGVPAIKDELMLTAALDIAYDGHLSRATQRKLHANGIKIGPLGAKTYGQWKKTRPRRTVSRPPLSRGPSGQQRPT
jgi:hypothetical protein